MKDYGIDLGAGFLAGFLVIFSVTLVGFLGSRMLFWFLLIAMDAISFLAYAQLPSFHRRDGGNSTLRSVFASFIVFSIGVFLVGVFVAYYAVYLLGHGPGFFL